MRHLLITIWIIAFSLTINAQNTAINNTGNAPDASAMLDIQSTDKGVLIPRMTTIQRELINMPANGLLVFDTSSQGFWFYNNDQWVELVETPAHLSDDDNDTDIHVEMSPDEDAIRMRIQGDEGFVLQQSANGVHRFSTYEFSRNLFFGHNAGANSSSGFNTFLGYETGMNNLGGSQNVFMGYQAGMENGEGDGNSIIGYRAGRGNTGSFNVFMGRNAGLVNDGTGNVFIGYNSGDSNISGSNNVFLGYNCAIGNTEGARNTIIGQGSGHYNSTGSDNTFIGENSGRRNRTGERNVALGVSALGPNLSSGDLGDENTAIGFQAGFYLNNSSSNTYVGDHAGFNNSTGDGNTLIGSEAGYFMNNGRHNTALGYRAYRSSNFGHNNIAIGDSSMLVSSGSHNISIGTLAGLSSEGSYNIFLGREAGSENDGASQNVFIGDYSGRENTDGVQNTFLGAEAGRLNTVGNSNSFMGFHAGDRNSSGTENTYMGNLAGHGNTVGNNNVSLGYRSLYGNSLGSGNVAIGHNALANFLEVNQDLDQIENTAIGFQSGDFDEGNYNITLGSRTRAGSNQYNIAIGHEASTTGLNVLTNADYGIAIGYQAEVSGNEGIAIGKNTSTIGRNMIIGNNGYNSLGVFNSVGIGHDVVLNQQNAIILGDENNANLNIGVGTNTPNAKFEIYNTDFWSKLLSVIQEGEIAFEVKDNLGVNIGAAALPPVRGLVVDGNTLLNSDLEVVDDLRLGDQLYINTTVMPTDYQVAIDGKVACTEIRVQAVADWPDYVFEADYPLMSIDNFRKFIAKNKHLPGVPTATEINEKGFEIGKTLEILLEKIEELSLYILQLEKRLSDIENKK